MCTYCGTNKYRKIYQHHYGAIPREANGRAYEVHHIDGNHSNNDPVNLCAITINEHYQKHLDAGDFGACALIATRMDLSPDQISKIATDYNLDRVDSGTHPFVGGNVQRQMNAERVKNKTHPFMKRADGSSASSDQVKNGTHPALSGELGRRNNKKMLNDGTHPFMKRADGSSIASDRAKAGTNPLQGGTIQRQMIANGTSPSQYKWTCKHCNKSGKGKGNYTKYHGDSCKLLLRTDVSLISTVPY